MNILYCGDKNTKKGITLSALSLVKNTKEELFVTIITASVSMADVECQGIEEDFAPFLESILKKENEKSKVQIIDVSNLFLKEFPTSNKNTRFTLGCMLRLFSDMVPLPDKVLYLDYDVVCLKDFSAFYNTDLKGVEFGGVVDNFGRFFYSPDYVNSGVLLMNMEEIRKSGLLKRCREKVSSKKMLLPDQTALNKEAESIMIMPRIFNEQKEESSDTVFRHFSTTFRFFPIIRKVSVKPWDKERMHKVLKTFEYDFLIDEAHTLYNSYERRHQ